MNYLCVSLILCLMLGLTTAYLVDPSLRDDSYLADDELGRYERSYGGSESNGIAGLDNVRRARALDLRSSQLKKSKRDNPPPNLCIPWRSPCILDANLQRQYDFLHCCSNMVCKCSFWGSNCRCTSRLV